MTNTLIFLLVTLILLNTWLIALILVSCRYEELPNGKNMYDFDEDRHNEYY